MHGQHGFVEKAVCLVMGGLGMMAANQKKGLANLKRISEQN